MATSDQMRRAMAARPGIDNFCSFCHATAGFSCVDGYNRRMVLTHMVRRTEEASDWARKYDRKYRQPVLGGGFQQGRNGLRKRPANAGRIEL